jgi:hypothetical protein
MPKEENTRIEISETPGTIHPAVHVLGEQIGGKLYFTPQALGEAVAQAMRFEREACAKIADAAIMDGSVIGSDNAEDIASAIRARSSC